MKRKTRFRGSGRQGDLESIASGQRGGKSTSLTREDNEDDENARFKLRRGKTRKALRKETRKRLKAERHEKKLQWQRNRRAKSGKVLNEQLEELDYNESESTNEQQPLSRGPTPGTSIDDRDMELDYLEKKLLPRGSGSTPSKDAVLTKLKSEFIKDGFDEEFLDFLSSIGGGKYQPIDKINQTAIKGKMKKSNETRETNENEEDIDLGVEWCDVLQECMDEEPKEGDNSETPMNPGNGQSPSEPKITKRRKRRKGNLASSLKERINAEPQITLEEGMRQVIGLINRLSEGTFTIVARQLIEVHRKTAKDDIDILLLHTCNSIIKMIVEDINTVASLVAVQTALITALSNRIGINVLYIYCHLAMMKLNEMLDILLSSTEDMYNRDNRVVARNCILVFSLLCYFEKLDVDILFHIIRNVAREGLTEHVSQLLLSLLKYCAPTIKQIDPTSFTQIMSFFTTLLQNYKDVHGDISKSRIRFFEYEVESFKVAKAMKSFDEFAFLKTSLANGEFRSRRDGNEIVSHKIFMLFSNSSELQGGTQPTAVLEKLMEGSCDFLPDEEGEKEPSLLAKANELRIYSNLGKSVFMAVMGAISPTHAMERIIQLGYKIEEYSDILCVIIRCLVSEKLYNEYYLQVVQKLCTLPSQTGKRFTRGITSACITTIQKIKRMEETRIEIFTHFLADLIRLHLVRLRVVRFIDMESEEATVFFEKLLTNLTVRSAVEYEEYVIAELLSIEEEKVGNKAHGLAPNSLPVFEKMVTVWKSGNMKECCQKLVSEDYSVILVEAASRIFK